MNSAADEDHTGGRLAHLVRLARQARPYWPRLGFAFAAAACVAVLTAVQPLFTRAVIDRALPAASRPADPRLLVALLAGMLVVGLGAAVGMGARRQLAGRVSVDVEADLRESLYEHLQALDMRFHEQVPTGQLMSRGSSDLQAIRQYLMTVPWSLTLVLQIIVVVAAMFMLDWPLAIVATLASPFLVLATIRFSQRFDPVIWKMQQSLGELAGVVEETITGIRVVKGFGRERHQVERLAGKADRIFDSAVESIRLRARFVPLFNLLPSFGAAAVLWAGGRAVLSGRITLGTLVAFSAYVTLLISPTRSLGNVVTSMQKASTAVGRVFDVLDTPPGVADKAGAKRLLAPRGEVRWDHVRFAFPGGGPVLDDVMLQIQGGTSLAVVGPTGCGKTTMARTLLRFVEPASGRVLIDGTDVAEVTLRSLRSTIGMVFEDTFLFSDTISANIAFGHPDAPFEDIVRAAAIAQAHEFIQDLPEQYDTQVGEQGYTLSGGQRQRIAIARAILKNPTILVLDDATSSVDARVEAQIRRGLQEAMSNRTTLIIARRPSTAALADRVALMERGSIVAVGTHEDLWHRLPAYRSALAAQPVAAEDEAIDEAAS